MRFVSGGAGNVHLSREYHFKFSESEWPTVQDPRVSKKLRMVMGTVRQIV